MTKKYQVVSRRDRRAMARWLAKHGQGLLPLVELVERTDLAPEELVDVTGLATIEMRLSTPAPARKLMSRVQAPNRRYARYVV